MTGSAYLDAASSEPLHPAARDTLMAALEHGYADPRRLHGPARNARLMLDNAREVVATCLGVRPDEVTFTPSGTHAVHLGVLGLLAGRARVSPVLAHSAVEHSSVVHAAQWHAARGGEVVELPVDREGRSSTELPDGPLGLVAVQAANHEVGTIQPVEQVAEAAGETPLFMDACAAAGRVALPDGWAAAAVSAHKWGGPAGVGALVVRKGARWRQPFPGDDRIDERTTGFENVPGALAAAAALQAMTAERDDLAARQHALVDEIRTRVAATVPDVEVVGSADHRLPHLVTFSCLYVDGEALVAELDRRGFGVASGSACTASTLEPSHVLAAMGVLTHGNVRVSLTRDVDRTQVDAFLDVLPEVVAAIRAEAGL
ncbi:cysteine desulfurase family protein [Nocardioides sp. Soil796]|uniref:cysteine desulfurase family protein n=1 Tax=Nocardioides sp. Soil796 TaxID=1736412 RepID=UPI0007101C32|nr:aminotransferase class V-fold PLP-dependent enzyme [Nocardioides sp. Soil796]KRF15916.1 aminotransferase V [Nocardioides sp. Soil796]